MSTPFLDGVLPLQTVYPTISICLHLIAIKIANRLSVEESQSIIKGFLFLKSNLVNIH